MKTRTVKASELVNMVGATVIIRVTIAMVITNPRTHWIMVESDDQETYGWAWNEHVEVLCDEVTDEDEDG